MKTPFSVLVLCYILSSTYTVAQEADSLNWFPYKTGDLWEYWAYDGVGLDTAQIINIKDSVLADGKIHLTQLHRFINPVMDEVFFHYTIDTTTADVLQPFSEPTDPPRITNVPVYKFNVQQGDQWVVYDYAAAGGGGYEMARVNQIYEGILFGRNTTFMKMHYYGAADSADTLGLSRHWASLAKGFGLIEEVSSEFGFSYFLKGVVIDGVLYGDTTSVVTSVDDYPANDLPKNFELKQNYPNPFNPRTAIRYSVPQRALVRLVVYDILGKKVKTLVEGVKEVGSYTILFDGTELQSGIYFCRLMAGRYIEVKKMILLK